MDKDSNQYSSEDLHFYHWETVLNANTLLLKVNAAEDLNQVEVRKRNSKFENKWESDYKPGKRLILIIPGNPGCIQFYQEFAVALWENLGRATAVWGISHAGHVYYEEMTGEVFDGATYPTLQFQIDHKRFFIENIISSDFEEIILIGHSIGAYIALQVAQQLKNHRISHVIGLFPTIERMALTPRGRIFTPVIKYGRWILFAFVFLLSWLPEWFRRRILQKYFSGKKNFFENSFFAEKKSDLEKQNNFGHLSDGAVNLTCLPSFRNCILMAKDEMEQLDELDRKLFEKSGKHRIILYYGRDDHWCPEEFFSQISQTFPDGEFHLCEKGFDHAFMISDVGPLAEIVSKWLEEKN